MNNNHKVKTAIIQGVAALLCCAVVAVGGNTIADKVCENKLSVADKAGSGNTAVSADVGGDAAEADAAVSDDSGIVADTADTQTDAVVDDGMADTSADVAADSGSTDAAEPADSGSTAAAPAGNSGSSNSGNSGAQAKQITATSGLSSSNIAEVLTYYKLVAKKNNSKTYTTKMTMTSLDGGSGLVGGAISMFEPIAKKALEKNSSTNTGTPGAPDQIVASDWKSAKAVNDGKFTTVTIQVKEQTDGANGKMHEGPVGHSIGVLDGVDRAMEDLPGVSADFSTAKFALKYTNAYIKFKVNNATGDFVKGSCEWHHNVNVIMDDLKVKIGIASAHIQGGKGVVNYSVTY